MTSLQADTSALRGTQGSFETVATSVASTLAELTSAIEAEGECWGSDEIGQNFAESYTPGVGDGSTGIGALSTVMSKLGEGAVHIANAFDDLDDQQASDIGALTADLDI